ncbi:hypothetical protein BY996DRAFT_8544607 [Phakopsora pachyrhizi]|nr:hypothetical protein BY996DRAFT_8544607 [Phakopsora pachyrhizi]
MTFPVVLLDIIKLDSSFDSTIKSYWNDHYNRRRVNLACALKRCYLAYLDGSAVDRIHVLTLEADTFKRTGSPISLDGHEAGGLVAHEDGKDGRMIWKRALNGPTVRAYMGQTSTPDINGDLVYSEKAKLYCAYFVATAYSGEFNGHFGDSIQCVDPDEDTGSIWLNTNSRRMEGPKISNENTAVGSSGEPSKRIKKIKSLETVYRSWVNVNVNVYIFIYLNNTNNNNTLVGGMSGSLLCSCQIPKDSNRWQSSKRRVAYFGKEASSYQDLWMVTLRGSSKRQDGDVDQRSGHPVPVNTRAHLTFLVNSQGKMQGKEIVEQIPVSGDMVTMADGRVCWPYSPQPGLSKVEGSSNTRQHPVYRLR